MILILKWCKHTCILVYIIFLKYNKNYQKKKSKKKAELHVLTFLQGQGQLHPAMQHPVPLVSLEPQQGHHSLGLFCLACQAPPSKYSLPRKTTKQKLELLVGRPIFPSCKLGPSFTEPETITVEVTLIWTIHSPHKLCLVGRVGVWGCGWGGGGWGGGAKIH